MTPPLLHLHRLRLAFRLLRMGRFSRLRLRGSIRRDLLRFQLLVDLHSVEYHHSNPNHNRNARIQPNGLFDGIFWQIFIQQIRRWPAPPRHFLTVLNHPMRSVFQHRGKSEYLNRQRFDMFRRDTILLPGRTSRWPRFRRFRRFFNRYRFLLHGYRFFRLSGWLSVSTLSGSLSLSGFGSVDAGVWSSGGSRFVTVSDNVSMLVAGEFWPSPSLWLFWFWFVSSGFRLSSF